MGSTRSTIKLINGEDTLRILSEQAPVGACIMQDGRFCYINSFFSSATGYTADELLGRDSLEIVVPEDRHMVRENTINMLKREITSPYQFRVIRKDNGIIWVMATVKSIQYRGRPAVLGNYMEITGRRQVEESLKDSEEKYRELANSITDIFFAMDEHLRYTYWNKASEILTGISAQDAIGRSLLEVFADRPATRNAEKVYRNALKTQQPQTFVNGFDIGDRHYVFEISAYPSRGGISVFARDITERKQAEQRLRQAEQEKDALLEEAPVSIIHADLDGRITYVNKRFEQESGYSRKEIMGKLGLQLGWFSPDTTEYFAQRMAARLTGGPAKHWETEFKCKDGRQIWIELEGKILEKLGVPVGFQIIASNITERKEMEEALRHSEERYRTILEETGDGYFETDLAGNFTFVNDAQTRLLGYPRKEIIGVNFKAFTPEEKVKVVFEAFNRMYKTGEPLRNFVDEVIRRDGSHGLAEISAFPIRKDNGEIIGFRGVRHDITERKKMEEILRQSEERYRTILEQMEDAYFEVDLGGHITFANNSVCRDLGYSKEELIGMSYKKFTAEADVESLFHVFNEVYRTGVSNRGFPWRTVRKDGIPGFAETSISLLRNHKGEAVGFRGVGRDITGRRQAEEALRRSEERYRTMLEEMEEGYYEVDLEGNFTFVNDAMTRILGYSRHELIGRNYKSYTPEEAVESIFQAFNRVYRTGETLKWFPMPEIRKDGTRIVAEDSVFPLRNEKAEVVGFRGISRDITERKRMEEALRQSGENYRTLFDNSVIGTIVLDAETMKVVMANRAAARIFGFDSVEEGIGLNPLYLVVPEDKERVINAITKELFEQDLRMTHEFRAITKRGTTIWVSATGSRIMHEGRLAGLISFTDISEQMSHRDRLVMTDRLASLGEMASGAAHELNNPLTTIIGFSQLLLQKEVPDDIREDLKLINGEAERAADVTRNLLTFAGRHPPMRRLNQINNIIEDVLRLRVYDHKARGIEVERQFAPDLPEVMADYFQIQQVFMNIIINAEYFMINAHNRGTLTITTKEENDTAVILFTDDGPGIPPENLGRVFDPFFTTKEAGKGTGLGLSICHGIVTEHGGQIYARSQLGKGATIVVELPVEGERRS